MSSPTRCRSPGLLLLTGEAGPRLGSDDCVLPAPCRVTRKQLGKLTYLRLRLPFCGSGICYWFWYQRKGLEARPLVVFTALLSLPRGSGNRPTPDTTSVHCVPGWTHEDRALGVAAGRPLSWTMLAVVATLRNGQSSSGGPLSTLPPHPTLRPSAGRLEGWHAGPGWHTVGS